MHQRSSIVVKSSCFIFTSRVACYHLCLCILICIKFDSNSINESFQINPKYLGFESAIRSENTLIKLKLNNFQFSRQQTIAFYINVSFKCCKWTALFRCWIRNTINCHSKVNMAFSTSIKIKYFLKTLLDWWSWSSFKIADYLNQVIYNKIMTTKQHFV